MTPPPQPPSDDLAEQRASGEALELKEQLLRGELPSADAPDPLPAGDSCHFVCPVRFGRRRSDQFGHLILSKRWLRFRGALDTSVPWSEVATVVRIASDLVVTLHDTHRQLRVSCGSLSEAARGAVMAEYLVEAARIRSKTVAASQPIAL